MNTPVKSIPQMEPWFDEAEAKALYDYMHTGGWVTEFKKTEEFERAIAKYTGAKHCIVSNNGTVTLILIAMACGIGPGDEVIVPNFTMIATPNSVKLLGATSVFVDVEPETLCMDISLAERAITPRTRAIMLVAANARYPKAGIQAFETLCRKHKIHLIEDAAQSLGSFYPDGRHIGRAGIVASFSFSSPKIISTGQGGAIITDDDAFAANIRKLKDFGRTEGGIDIHDSIGYNFKFTDIQAIIGIEQMKKLPWRVERKKEILRLYRQELGNLPQIAFFEQDLAHTTPWFIDVLAEQRDALRAWLKERRIGTRLMYPPINKQKAYLAPGEHPVSNQVGEKGLWLPSANQLSDKDVKTICAAIREFYR